MANRNNQFKKGFFSLLILIMIFSMLSQAMGEGVLLEKLLSKGSKGDQVRDLQDRLNSLGYSVGAVDGIFGSLTESALKDFQRVNNLTESGVLDDATYQMLYMNNQRGGNPVGAYAYYTGEYRPNKKLHGYGYFVGDCGWEEANRKAMAMGGYLVAINSVEEYTEIQSEIIERDLSDVAFWIGAARDRRHGPKSIDYCWIGAEGLPSLELFDCDIELSGMNPWALGEPNYQNAQGEAESYVRMLFSNEEKRWVWEDSTGSVDPWRKTGYIVEFEIEKSLSQMPALDRYVTTQPMLNYPTIMPAPSLERPAIYNDSLSIVRMEGNSLTARVSTNSSCTMYVEFVNPVNNKTLFSNNYYIESGLWETPVRLDIDKEKFNLLPISFGVCAVLYNDNPGTGVRQELTEWQIKTVSVSREIIEANASEVQNTPDKTLSAAFVLASNPEERNPAVSVQIFDTINQSLITTVALGEAVSLPQGEYRAVTPGGESADTYFMVKNRNITVPLLDQPPEDQMLDRPFNVTIELPPTIAYLAETASILISALPGNSVVASIKAGETLSLFPGNYVAAIVNQPVIQTEFTVLDRACKVVLSDVPRPVVRSEDAVIVAENAMNNAYRVTLVRESDPARKDDSAVVQLFDAYDGEALGEASVGSAFYLRQGTYRAKLGDEETIFAVMGKPQIVRLRDVQPGIVEGSITDEYSGAAIAGAVIELELQGFTYATRTDENGHYSFANLPAANGRLKLKGGMGNPYEVTSRNVTVLPGETASADLSARHKRYVQFVGHLIDGTPDYLVQASVFLSNVQAGYYGPVDQEYWFLGSDMYVKVDHCLAAQSPDGNPVNAEIYEPETTFNLGSDDHRKKWAPVSNGKSYLDSLGVVNTGNPFLISGYVRPDRLKENNPDYDECFTGWSDELIEIISIEPYSDAQ